MTGEREGVQYKRNVTQVKKYEQPTEMTKPIGVQNSEKLPTRVEDKNHLSNHSEHENPNTSLTTSVSETSNKMLCDTGQNINWGVNFKVNIQYGRDICQ